MTFETQPSGCKANTEFELRWVEMPLNHEVSEQQRREPNSNPKVEILYC